MTQKAQGRFTSLLQPESTTTAEQLQGAMDIHFAATSLPAPGMCTAGTLFTTIYTHGLLNTTSMSTWTVEHTMDLC